MGTIRHINITIDGISPLYKLYWKCSQTRDKWQRVTENFTGDFELGYETIYWFIVTGDVATAETPYMHYLKKDGTYTDFSGTPKNQEIDGVTVSGCSIQWGSNGGAITYAVTVNFIAQYKKIINITPNLTNFTAKYKISTLMVDHENINGVISVPQSTIDFRFYPENGATVEENPTIVTSSRTFSTSWNGTYYSATITSDYMSDDVTINAVGVLVTRYTINTTLENSTCNIESGTQFNEGATIDVTVTANEGYYFSTVPTINGVEMETQEIEYPKNYSLSVTMDGNKELVASAVAIPVTRYTINTTLENSTCNIESGTQFNEGTTINVTVTANEGYYFATVPTISGVEMTTTETEKPKNYSLSVTMDGNKELVASAVAIPETYKVTVIISNCTCSINDGDTFEKGAEFNATLTPNNGYYFESAPRLRAYRQAVATYYDFVEGENNTWYLTVSGSETKYWSNNPQQNPRIIASAQVIPSPSVSKYCFVTLYKPSAENMESLQAVRFYKDTSGNYIDLGQYISNVFKTFFTVPTSKTAKIILGGYDSNVESPVIENDTIILDCGSIEVKGKYNNIMDYKNTTIDIFLPFIGVVNLDINKCLGKTLSLTYSINLVNGKGVVTLIDENNIIVYSSSCEPTFKMPYKVNQLDTIQGDISIESNYLLGFTPYLIIRRDKSIDTPTKSDIGSIALATYNGYIKGRLLNNTILATEKEKAEIESLFNSGVYI